MIKINRDRIRFSQGRYKIDNKMSSIRNKWLQKNNLRINNLKEKKKN